MGSVYSSVLKRAALTPPKPSTYGHDEKGHVQFKHDEAVCCHRLFPNILKSVLPCCMKQYYRGMPDVIPITLKGGLSVATVARKTKQRETDFTILYSHGSGSDLGLEAPIIRHFERALAVNVVAYDYTGYGLSTGEASEEHCFESAEAVFQALTAGGVFFEDPVPPSHIILYGQSLGSSPSMFLAEKHPEVAGVVLESPILSLGRTCCHWSCCLSIDSKLTCFACPSTENDLFDSFDRLDGISSPVLILHGTSDSVVPFWHAKEISNLIRGKSNLVGVEGAGHYDVRERLGDGAYFKHIDTFVENVEAATLKLEAVRTSDIDIDISSSSSSL